MVQQKPASYSGLRILILIPAVLLVFTRLWPLLNAFAAAFKQFNFMKGIEGSEWVGFANFEWLFANRKFLPALETTRNYGLALLVSAVLLAFLSAILIPKLRSPLARAVILSAALLLSFLPEQLLLEGVLALGMTPASGLYEAGHILSGIVNQAGFAILLGAAGACLAQNSSRPILRYSGAFLVLSLRLVQFFSSCLVAFEMVRPSTEASLFSLSYQSGILTGNISGASAVSTFVNLLQLLPVIAVVLFMLLALYRKDTSLPLAAGGKAKAIPVAVLCVLGLVFFIAGVVIAMSGMGPDGNYLPRAVIFSLIHMLVGSVVFAIFAVPGAAASASFKRPLVPALFLIFTGLSGGLMMEYYMGRSLQLVNTVIGPPIFAALSLMPFAAVISYLFYLNRGKGLAFALPVLGLALQSVLTNVIYPILLTNSGETQTLPFYAYMVLAQYGGAGNSFSGSAIVLTLLSLGLWALSCISLFRMPAAADAPAYAEIPAAQFMGGNPGAYPNVPR